MSGVVDGIQPIKIKINKDFSGYFDVLENIDISGRRSETGFIDKNKLVVRMRPGTTKDGNTLTGGTGTSRLFFHTTYQKNRVVVRGYNNRVYWKKAGVWTDLGVNFSGNNFHYNTIRLPMNLNFTDPTTYTTPSDATGSEKVKISASDTTPLNNIGKFIFIVDNSGDNQSYRGCFGDITGVDNGEYLIGTSGILGNAIVNPDNSITYIGLKSGSTYKIYDIVGEYLQVMNGVSYDRYFTVDGSNNFIENTTFQGLATKSLRNVQLITSSQFIYKQIFHNNSMWSFNKNCVCESAGQLGNPFFHNFTGVRTVSTRGDIIDIAEYRNRLIIGGSNFVKLRKTDGVLDNISTVWGIKENGFIDMNVDAYIFSSNKKVYSLIENINGTISANDIGEMVENYTNDFNINICMGFDGKRFFIYGQKDQNTLGKIIVLDLRYKYWSIYTGLYPSSIINEGGVTYITDINSDTVRYFDDTQITDNGTKITQRLLLREIDLDNVFTQKVIKDMFFWFDNYDQSLKVKLYGSLNRTNGTIIEKDFYIEEKIPVNPAPSIGIGIIGDNILGGDSFISDISYPYMEQIAVGRDQANIWKIEMVGIDGSPFYLCQCDILIGKYGDEYQYFDSSHTY